MNEYLRDFVNENVGEECGGSSSLTNPTTIQMQLNEALTRLDKLEAGIGFTVSIQDQAFLPFYKNGSSFIALIPTNGTITMATVMSDKASENEGLGTVVVTVHKASTTTVSEREINHKNRVSSAILSIPVYAGEWIEVSAKPYSYEVGGHGSPGDDDYEAPSIVTSSATMVFCGAILQLPAKTYGVSKG